MKKNINKHHCILHIKERLRCRLKTLWVSLHFAHQREHCVCRFKVLLVSLRFANQEDHYDLLTYPCVFAYGRGIWKEMHLRGRTLHLGGMICAFQGNDLWELISGIGDQVCDLDEWRDSSFDSMRFEIWYEPLFGFILSNWNRLKLCVEFILVCLYM